jgi:cell division transport system permease protein
MTRKYKKLKRTKLGSYPYTTVVLSITLALFVIGLFSILIFHASKLSELIKNKFEVHAYLDRNLNLQKKDSIVNDVRQLHYVLRKDGSPQVTFVSEEDAAKKFISETGEDFYKVLGANPLRASVVIKIDYRFADTKNLKKIREVLEGIDGIYEVDYKENLINQINKNIRNISFILLLFAGILLVTAILLINNTIRLALFSQRFLIRSMQLIGATKFFIQKPFLTRAGIQGFFSGIIASVLLILILQYLYNVIPELTELSDTGSLAMIFILLIITGIFIGICSSYIAINRYLRMSLDELY